MFQCTDWFTNKVITTCIHTYQITNRWPLCAGWFVCNTSGRKKGIFFAGLCLSTDCFIPRERHLAAEAAKSTQMKDNLVSINFSCGKSTCYEDSKLLRKLPDNPSYGPDRRLQLLTECLSPLTCCDVYQVGWLKCVCVCVCVQVYISRWGLKPEYTQTHGDSCHGGDLNWGPHGYKSL